MEGDPIMDWGSLLTNPKKWTKAGLVSIGVTGAVCWKDYRGNLGEPTLSLLMSKTLAYNQKGEVAEG